MSELSFAAPPPPEERRRALGDALGALIPGWRPLACDVLGADARIDWVGCDGDGRCVIVLIAEAGEDLSLIAHGLAQREWVSARVADWAQLAPDTGLRPGAAVRVFLLAPGFAPATRAAARAVSDRDLHLAEMRFVRNGSGVSPLLDPIAQPQDDASGAGAASGGFRSGLSAADLDLTQAERAEFEER